MAPLHYSLGESTRLRLKKKKILNLPGEFLRYNLESPVTLTLFIWNILFYYTDLNSPLNSQRYKKVRKIVKSTPVYSD